MVKKNVYMVQTNIKYEDTMYIPYAAGALAAFAWNDETVKAGYRLKGILCMRDKIEQAVSSLDSPYIAAFSNYIWNFEYNKALAQRIKTGFPDCIVIFGGHNVPPGTSLLDEHRFIDVLIHGEGEEAFRDILLSLQNGGSFDLISNISYRDSSGKTVNTHASPVTCTDIPSPYTAGIFDGIIATYPTIQFSAILETNRGCPYSCSFCDWCRLTSKVRLLPEKRVLGDLVWMSEHNIEFCYCADANFGMFPRDEKFIDKLIELNRKNGYPNKFRVNYSKHNNATVFRINKKLNDYGISKGATISFQSLSQEVLENIGRKNMSLSKFSELMSLYGKEGIATYSELILGLPGETYESFCDGVGKLLEAGQHTSILIYNCELIVNSIMANENYMKKFGIRASATPLYLRHDEPDCDEIPEFSKSVTATSSMNEEEWINSNLFSVIVQSCHGMGLLRYFAIYLFYEKGIKYQEFYKSLVMWAEKHQETVIGKELLFMRGEFKKIAAGSGLWSYTNTVFGNVTWPYEEGAYLDFAYRLHDFYSEVRQFLAGYTIEKDIFDGLLQYQISLIKLPGIKSMASCFEYDFPGYFSKALVNAHEDLKKKKIHVFAEDGFMPPEWKDYAREYIWFGRKEQRNIFSEFTVKEIIE